MHDITSILAQVGWILDQFDICTKQTNKKCEIFKKS